MFSLTKNVNKLSNNTNIKSYLFVLFNKNPFIVSKKYERFTEASLSFCCRSKQCLLISSFNLENICSSYYFENKRCFSKRRDSKRTTKIEEDSDSDIDDEHDEQEADKVESFGDNIIRKNVSSLRLDSVVKAGLGLTKKKIEQEFYAFKLRVNGKPAVKKAMNIYIGDELDVIKDFSPDTSKYLIVDRIIIKHIDKVTATGQFPVEMEVLKKLTIENYEEPWNPSNVGQLDK